MDESKAALVPKYSPCGHPMVSDCEACPQCCYICGHPRGGPLALIANPKFLSPSRGIELLQCLSRTPVPGKVDLGRLDNERCNLIIGMNLITPTIIH